jgi:transposase
MEYERTSMAQFQEIKRLIEAGHTDRQIAKSLHCRRTLVAGVRKGEVTGEIISRGKKFENKLPPGWALPLDWAAVEKDISEGHQIKRIWEEVAESVTSHSNFFKYVKIRFASLLQSTVTLREFKAGEYSEVDWAGDKLEWMDLRTGEIHEAHVFVGILCFSQKIFSFACENEKKCNWLDSHRRMFEFYGGTTKVVVPVGSCELNEELYLKKHSRHELEFDLLARGLKRDQIKMPDRTLSGIAKYLSVLD